VRYDSAHAEYHRHEAGYPEPGGIVEWFGDVPMSQRGSFAVQHITSNCGPWHAVLPALVESGKEEPTS
jgi:hypothetical protein